MIDICPFDDVLPGHSEYSAPNHIVLTDWSEHCSLNHYVWIDSCNSPYSSSLSLTPQEIFGIYFYGFKNVNEDAIWGVLSTGAQVDDSKSFIYNTIYALNSQGMRYIEYSITDFQIDGDTGQMFVTVEFDANGYRLSRDKEIPFVRENGVWKIDNFVRLP